MKIYSTSSFKSPESDLKKFDAWVKNLENVNGRNYERISIQTALGNTHVWGHNTINYSETLIIFPGARTTSLFWDLDKGLDHFNSNLRIFLVETNGLPNLSHGATPDIKSNDFGIWAASVFDGLKINSAYVAGASFGGLICMKMAITNPEKIKAAFLLNPGCLQPFSLSFKNLYYNLLPIFSPTYKNVKKFLDAAILSKPNHQLSDNAEQLLIDYEILALTRHKDKAQKPYFMQDQLTQVKSPTYLLLGDKDLLFPYAKSEMNARKLIPTLKEVKVFSNVGHGIETYAPALQYVNKLISNNP